MSSPEDQTTTDESRFFERLGSAIEESTLRHLTLSKPVSEKTDAEKVTARPVIINEASLWQVSRRVNNQELHENIEPSELLNRVRQALGETFRNCHVQTTEADIEARTKASGSFRLRIGKPSFRGEAETTHDRKKGYLIPEGTPCQFLHEIGVMTAEGRVRNARQKKFRQINHYLEIVAGTLSHLPSEGTLNIVDFGCGKSYLTFALHHWLTVIRKRSVNIIGLDQKRDVVADCNRIVKTLGCDGLRFQPGDLATYVPDGSVDMCVSLHACDTATDAALARAIEWSADVILAAPCCQHEIATMIENRSLSLLTTHGILKERFAALATDALRARLLDLIGYSTKVIEFIDLEHTPKNVLIRAIRRDRPRKSAEQQKWTQRYDEFKELLGIDSFAMEDMLTRSGFLGEIDSEYED